MRSTTIRYAEARHAGLTEDKVAAIDDETSDLITPRERAALRFAPLMAEDHHKIDDRVWENLRRHFTEAEIVALAANITVNLGLGRFNAVVGIDPV